VERDGERNVLDAHAASSTTGLRYPVGIDSIDFARLRVSRPAQQVPAGAEVGVAEHDNCSARLNLSSAGDDPRLTLRDRLFFEQVEWLTDHRLPFPTLT